VLDGFHVCDQVLALQGFDGCAEDGIVEVGARFDGFGPDAFATGFVDEPVDYFVLWFETAVSVIIPLAPIHIQEKGRVAWTTDLRASS
jgi:hypothetical protein